MSFLYKRFFTGTLDEKRLLASPTCHGIRASCGLPVPAAR
jgi:hypothetical protein